MSRAKVLPRKAQRILTPTGGYLEGFTHTLQPYVGCQFSCVYCYVREMTVQRANPYGLPWSGWISPKLGAPEVLRRAAARGGLAGARIFCASTTDPYVPLERRLRLTRGCLEVMVERPPEALVVQTRSPLVLRDRDLLRALPRVVVSITVTTADEEVRRAFEPDSPSLTRRLDTLTALREAGIRVQAAVSPLLPGDFERLARALRGRVDRVVLDDFVSGDGQGGARSRAALALLDARGEEGFARPETLERAGQVFRAVLGPERVAFSREGFADLAWLEDGP